MYSVGKRRRVTLRARPRYVPRPRAGMRFSTAYPIPPTYSQQAVRGLVAAARRSAPAYACGELKGVDTLLQPLNPIPSVGDNEGSFVLNLIQSGSGSFNRVGRKIRMKSVRVKFIMDCLSDNNGGAAATKGVVARACLVYDKNPSGGAIPNFDHIVGKTSQAGTETYNMMYNVAFDRTGRFKIIRDWYHVFDPLGIPGNAEEGGVRKWFLDEYVDLKGLETIYGDNSDPAAYTDIQSGGLILYLRAQTEDNTVSAMQVGSVARLRYTD